MTSTERRLAPLEPGEFSPEAAELLLGTADAVAALEGRAAADAPQILNILRTMAHHPSLLRPFLGFATQLAQGALSRRSSELLALRTAWNCRSDFEWGHHVVYARAAGLTEEEIARISESPASTAWAEADRLLLRAADELHADQDWSDETWRALEASYPAEQLVEIPFVVGQYTMLSMVANGTGVPLEDGLERLPGA